MFVQVIQGEVSDPAQLRAALDRWDQQLASGASGWLGSTAGVTDSGNFVALARFESEEAAQTNAARPEQDQWWTETSGLFTGEATFGNSTRVDVNLVGDPDQAGFVQVIQGRTSDPERSRELMAGDSPELAAFRPDIIGSIGVEHEGGAYTMAVYFTSEAEAREGERKEPPPELRSQMEEMNALSIGEPTFLDLREPWFYSPR